MIIGKSVRGGSSMAEHVKVRLKAGSREIEAEGPRGDVDELLAKWWTPPSADGDGEEEQIDLGRRPKRPGATSRKRATSPGSEGKGGVPLDLQPMINKMREDESHDTWEEKVLHTRSLINKIKLVCWYHNEPLTTGQIVKVLEGLGVKTQLSNVSTAIKDALAEFLQDGVRTKGAIIRYKLTGKTAKEFEAWLNTDE
jgi:hypothetical protein